MSSNAISKTLGIEHKPTNQLVPVVVETENKKLDESVDADYAYVRKNMRVAIDTCAQVLPSLVSLANETESANMFNSMTNFMKVFADMNKTLLDSAGAASKAKSSNKASKEAQEEFADDESGEKPMATEDFLRMLIDMKKSDQVREA